MTTQFSNHDTDHTSQSGMSFWKILAIIAVALIALAILAPVIKGLFWLGVIALAVYGGWMLLRRSGGSSTP